MNISIEANKKEVDFIDDVMSIKKHQDIQLIESDGFEGAEEIVTIIAALTPAVSFIIGKYFSYLKSKKPEIKIKIDGVEVYSKDMPSKAVEGLVKSLINKD